MPKQIKDKRITFKRVDEMTETWTPFATVWAHYRSMSVKESFECGADNSWNNVYFTIFKPKSWTLSTQDVIEYKGEDYYIEGMDLFEDQEGQNVRIHARTRF